MIDQSTAIQLAMAFLREQKNLELPLIEVGHSSKEFILKELGFKPANGNYFVSFGIVLEDRIDNLYNIQVNDETGEVSVFQQLL